MKQNTLTTGTTDGGPTNDYVVVDDTGDFIYYPSESTMLTDLEYLEEAVCVLDREGNHRRLAKEHNGNLRVGGSFGPVEFGWLRQAWIRNRHANMRSHQLQRFLPTDRGALLTQMFETLTLEQQTPAEEAGTWVLTLGGEETGINRLQDLNERLVRLNGLEAATVRDPYGHTYRPVRHAKHRIPARGGGNICLIEIHPSKKQHHHPTPPPGPEP